MTVQPSKKYNSKLNSPDLEILKGSFQFNIEDKKGLGVLGASCMVGL